MLLLEKLAWAEAEQILSSVNLLIYIYVMFSKWSYIKKSWNSAALWKDWKTYQTQINLEIGIGNDSTMHNLQTRSLGGVWLMTLIALLLEIILKNETEQQNHRNTTELFRQSTVK